MHFKRFYYFLFYKFFKISEAAPSRWLSDWKAELCVDILGLFVFSSLVLYYRSFIDVNSEIGNGNALLCFFILFSLFNYFIFHHKDKWRVIVQQFEALPIRTNRMMTFSAWLFVSLVIVNFVLSFYLFYQN